MVVWNVYCDWYSADNITIGIFTNLALAAREAMKITENMLQWNEVLANRHEEPWGFSIDITEKDSCDWGIGRVVETEFTGQIIFERVTVNDLS